MIKQTIIVSLISLFAIKPAIFSQNLPSAQLIANTIKSKTYISFDEYERDERYPIEYIQGRFTGKYAQECLLSYKVYQKEEFQIGLFNDWKNFIVLFYQTDNKWHYGNWFDEITGDLDTVDIDGDNIFELILTNEVVFHAVFESNYRLISIKNLETHELYGYYDGFLYANCFAEEKDTTLQEYEISFKDINQDGVKELIEDKTIGIVKEVVDCENILNKSIKTQIYCIKNKEYKKCEDNFND